MTDKIYSPYKLAIELGFSEREARHYAELNLDATKLRQIARAKDMPGMKPKLSKPEPKSEPTEYGSGIVLTHEVEPKPEPKKHKHYYHKDTGVCSCGAVRKAKK